MGSISISGSRKVAGQTGKTSGLFLEQGTGSVFHFGTPDPSMLVAAG
jgi:hypothetical protein